ncbi:MAG: Lrp/AsnC family transcriptional regulator [Candidatus Hodarchaeales archaeon]|jgi:DNA-binding Lrp family transcriptional regulator
MPSAFVLINSEVGKEQEILVTVKKIPFVVEAYAVYGVYDLIIRIEADDLETLKSVVSKNIRTIENITKTFTMIIE